MGSVSSRPERNGHRMSTSRWDIARLGARDSVSGAAEGDRHRACDGGGQAVGGLCPPWVLLRSSAQVVTGARGEEAAPHWDAPVLVGTRGTPPAKAACRSGCRSVLYLPGRPSPARAP